jgi:hypothetical protein
VWTDQRLRLDGVAAPVVHLVGEVGEVVDGAVHTRSRDGEIADIQQACGVVTDLACAHTVGHQGDGQRDRDEGGSARRHRGLSTEMAIPSV